MSDVFATVPADTSVVILSTPRTGSTALCRVLSERFGLIYHNEMFNSRYVNRQIFWLDRSSTKHTVSKIFPNHDYNEEEFTKAIADSFVIFLERRNLLDQACSYYVLSQSNRPWFAVDERPSEYSVVLETTKIAESIRDLMRLREQAESYRQHAHMVLEYDDIVDQLGNSSIQEYVKPINYDQLRDIVSKLLSILDRKDQ